MIFAFGTFEVSTQHFTLSNNGQILNVEPRVFELLVYFCQHPHRPISRDELIENVWNDRVISAAAVNRAVGELRKLIEQEASSPEFIQTVSKVGYRFDADVIVEQAQQTDVTAVAGGELEQQAKPSPRFNISTRLGYALAAILVVLGVFWFSVMQDENPQPDSIEWQERRITALKGQAFKVAGAADTDAIAFMYRPDADGFAQIWQKPVDGDASAVTNDDHYYLSMIYAGTDAIFATRFNNLHDRHCQIVHINMTTLEQTPVFDCARRASPSLAYDATRNLLYFTHRLDVNAPFAAYSYHLDTGRLKQVSFPDQDSNVRGDFALALSPNNQQLAVLSYQSDSSSLLKLINLEDFSEVDRHGTLDGIQSMTWYDETRLLLRDDRGLVFYQPQHRASQVIDDDTSILRPKASWPNQRIVFERGHTVANLTSLNIAETDDKEQLQADITASSGVNYWPTLANLSNKVAYLSDDSGELAVFIKPAQGRAFEAKLEQELKNHGNFHWSEDDRYLLASINGQLHRYDDQLRQWQVLLEDITNVHYVHSSFHDNILFSSDHGGSWQIWHYDIATDKLTPLTTKGGYSVQGDMRSGRLLITKFNQSGVYELDLSTGAERPILDDLDMTFWNKWKVRGQNIYFLEKDKLSRLNVDTLNKTTVMQPDSRLPATFSVSAKEDLLIFERFEPSQSDLWELVPKSPAAP